MLRILSVTIRNFLAFGNVPQTINLAADGLTLVLGENLDIGGANSRNGVGKSAIGQAICYALFGKPLTKIRLDNLVNAINGKEMLVGIDFEHHGKPCRIERGRKPNVLRFFRDGVQEIDEAQGENRRTQTEIERLVGMSPTLFRHIVALNTFTTPFLREEAAVQREVIEELFGITQLSQRAETLKKLIDDTKDQLRTVEATVKANTEANARIEQAIERATGDAHAWQTAQNRRIADLTAQVDALHEIDIDHEIAVFDRIDQWQEQRRDIDGRRHTTQQQIATLEQEIGRLQKDVQRYEAEARTSDGREIERLDRQAQLYRAEADQDIQPQIDRLEAESSRHRTAIASKEAEAQRLAADLETIMARLEHPDEHTCDTCGQGLAGTDHLALVIANLRQHEQSLTDQITRLFAEQDALALHAEVCDAEILHLRTSDRQRRDDLLAKSYALQDEIALVTAEIAKKQAYAQQQADDLQSMITVLDSERQTLFDQLNALPMLGECPESPYANRDAVWQVRQQRDRLMAQLEAEQTKPNPYGTKIEGLRGTLLVINYDDLNALTSHHKHEIFLYKLLTAKESFIRKTILDQNLRHLNKRLDHYVQELGLPHEVAFVADLSVDISLLGASFDFEQLSRGEMNRIILATSFGFRDVWESLNTSVNLMMIDECIDTGMDGAGVETTLGILTQMAEHQNVFLVSHREELRDRIDNVLTVRKENQFTSFA